MNFTIDPLLVSIGILFVIVIILLYMILKQNSKLNKFLIGNNAENISESISTVATSLKELETFKNEMEEYLLTVESRLRNSVQAVYTVRFNPFKGSTNSGGNQSFATAFLNESGSGMVISTLYARERMSIFSKPITKGVSEYELSDEEKEALNGALKLLNK